MEEKMKYFQKCVQETLETIGIKLPVVCEKENYKELDGLFSFSVNDRLSVIIHTFYNPIVVTKYQVFEEDGSLVGYFTFKDVIYEVATCLIWRLVSEHVEKTYSGQ